MKNLPKFYLLACLLFLDFAVFAQPGDEEDGGNLEGGDPLPGAPINSKLIILAILGVTFAFYTYRKYRRNNLI